MGQRHYDHSKQLTLTVITLSGFHCICALKNSLGEVLLELLGVRDSFYSFNKALSREKGLRMTKLN